MSRHDSESVSSAGTEISVSLDEGNRYIYYFTIFRSWQLLEDFSMVMDMTMLMYLVLVE